MLRGCQVTRKSFQSAIDVLLDQSPFRPFTIEMVNGQRYEVDHPRALATRDGTAIFVKPGGAPVWFDHQTVAAILGDIAGRKAS